MIAPTAEWLRAHRAGLRAFAKSSIHPEGGFAWLDDRGSPRLDQDVELWITCRMTHVFALGALEGDASCLAPLDHGVASLRGRLHDSRHGGWFAAVDPQGPTATAKEAYGHAFVLLAGASAYAAGHPEGEALLEAALDVIDAHFWRPADELVVDVWNRDWSQLEDYRGVNSNMHMVEALLAAGDITGDQRLVARAAAIVARVVHGFAASGAYFLPEHYTGDWQPRPDYNLEDPAHRFRPFGVTIGHLFEWSRLALHVAIALGDAAPEWILEDAKGLFEVAVRHGWNVDGAEGFVYTTDFSGEPVVRNRFHWVATEAIGSAWALHEATGEEAYLDWYARWWHYAQTYLIDETGSWRHELDPRNRPASDVWKGKPDVYHAYQAALLPALSRPSSLAAALKSVR